MSKKQATKKRRKRGIGLWLAWTWLAIIAFTALFGQWLPTPDPNLPNFPAKLQGLFTKGHILGTDGLGRDTFARLVAGSRVSLTVGLTTVAIGISVGGVIGVVAGYLRKSVDALVVAGINVMLAFPALVVLLSLMSVLDQSLFNISIVMGVLSIPIYTRVARANTLVMSEREFVLAAQAIGASQRRIVFKEIIPSVIPPILAFAATALGLMIVAEGALAFLGLSVKPPNATWGSMISEGRRYDEEYPHLVFVPSVAMFLTVLAFNFVGESLRKRITITRNSTV